MTIEFNCPECDCFLTTPDDRGGATAKCPQCGVQIEIPEAVALSNEALNPFDDSDSESNSKDCPFCGEEIRKSARFCRFCRSELDGERRSRQREDDAGGYYKPHRGGMILAFGILGWFVMPIVFAILAWVMGNNDLQEMDAGIMDPAGRDMTQIGRILGMVNCILMIVGLAVAFLFVLVFFGAALA